MSEIYEFLKECGTFFLSTINGNSPATRPMGGIMELGGELYFSTANTKNMYLQLIASPAIQIVALKHGTRDWIRVSGNAIEVHDLDAKQAMLDACPSLQRHFDSSKCATYALFKIVDAVSS